MRAIIEEAILFKFFYQFFGNVFGFVFSELNFFSTDKASSFEYNNLCMYELECIFEI